MNKLRNHACLIVSLLMQTVVYGQTSPQQSSVTGNVNADGQPLIAATITLLHLPDSSIIKAVLSDTTGHFLLSGIPAGKYLIRITSLSYGKYYSPTFTLDGAHPHHLSSVVLESDSRQLHDVEVTSRKSPVEQTLDKTIINVDASPATATLNALELMQRLPGVSVDQDGNISLKGRSGVLVLIDGKPSYLSPAELATLLSGMPGTNLDKIEIMTTPPANYDAAGSAGVINIKTKKLRSDGLNGNITLGGGIGRYPRSNSSINLNYHTGKVNFFGSYGYTYTEPWRNLRLRRNFYDSTRTLYQSLEQNFYRWENWYTHNVKAGADIALTKKTVAGIVLNGNYTSASKRSENKAIFLTPSRTVDSLLLAPGSYRNTFSNQGINLNMRHHFDSTDHTLDASFDYQYYDIEDRLSVNNAIFDSEGNKLQPDDLLNGFLPSNIRIYSGRIDYVRTLKHDIKLEAGVKSSYVKTDNDARYSHVLEQKYIEDNNLSNHFLYRENVNAAYITLNKKINSIWEAKLGFRVENTNSQGDQLTTNQTFNRDYTQLFPTAFFGYKASEAHQFSLSYGRRVLRPNYQDMNPFLFFLDKYTYRAGNSYLGPQSSHNIGLTHSYKGILTSSISYNKTTDIITTLVNQIEGSKIAYQTYGNLASSTIFTASIGLNISLLDWWHVNIYLEGDHADNMGYLNDLPIGLSGYYFNTSFSQEFRLWRYWTAELSGYYHSREVDGPNRLHPRGVLNFAVSRQVLQKKGTIKFNVSDIGKWYSYDADNLYQNVDLSSWYRIDSRIFSLAFTYRFSQGKSGRDYKHRSAADDEQSRVKPGN